MLGKLMLDKWQALRVLVTIALVAEGANLIPVIANDGKMPATIRSWEYPLEDYQDYQKYTVATSKTPFVWLAIGCQSSQICHSPRKWLLDQFCGSERIFFLAKKYHSPTA